MKKLIRFVILIQLIGIIHYKSAYSQYIKNTGIPFIINYLPEQYKASNQNWCILQDKRGIFYFGNTLGILEFDGVSWRLISLPNKAVVRSLLESENGNIYVGGLNELGYLQDNGYGITNFVSLTNLLPKKYKNFGDVWIINKSNGGIIFRTYDYLFYLKDHKFKITKAPKSFSSTSLIGNSLYVSEDEKGLNHLQNEILVKFSNQKLLDNEHSSILPYDKNHLLLATRHSGIFIYDGHVLKKWGFGIDSFLCKNLLYTSIQIDSNYYAFGTWMHGLIIVDKSGRPIQYINKANGLLSNAVYSLFVDREKNLWCALGRGISKIEINSPFSTFIHDNDIQCYTATIYKNDLFIGGEPYLYKTKLEKYHNPLQNNPVKIINCGKPQIWQLKVINNDLLGACSFNILKFGNKNLEEIPMQNEIIWNLLPVNEDSTLLMAGKNNGIFILKESQGHWTQRNKIEGYSENARWIDRDQKNNFWCSDYGKRIIKIQFDKDYRKVMHVNYYNLEPNYPLAIGHRITVTNGDVIASSSDGFYLYNENLNKFEPYQKLNSKIAKGYPVNITGQDKKGNLWFTDKNGLGEFVRQINDNYIVSRTAFYKFDSPSETYPVITLNDSNIIMELSNCIIHFDPYFKKNYNLKFRTLIRKIELPDVDSIIYGGGKSLFTNQIKYNQPKLHIKYHTNSIRFYFSASFYENCEKTKYQFKLIGYEKNWSSWTSETKKDYTNLPEGEYTFLVTSRNVFHENGDVVSFTFIIDAPWYRLFFMYFIYGFAIIVLIYYLLYLNSRRLRHANLALEQIINERTNEIQQQKEEMQVHYEQLKEINALKDKLYSIISHDLINTIGTTKSFSELLKRYITNMHDEKLSRYINALNISSKSAFELLTNLLNWTRLQTGRMQINLEKVNLVDLIMDGLTLYQALIESKKINIHKNFEESYFIYADKNMISTVLRNLLSNALKFTPLNGSITLSVFKSDSNIAFSIKDTGVGISSEDIKLLFRNDVYFQRHGTNNESGTGLGLWLIKNFVELHNGRLTIESEPDKGSTFTFIIPINPTS